MKNPSRLIFGKTWVGWLNILILQWFFVRLYYGDKWGFFKGVIPLTGWWNTYKYLEVKVKVRVHDGH